MAPIEIGPASRVAKSQKSGATGRFDLSALPQAQGFFVLCATAAFLEQGSRFLRGKLELADLLDYVVPEAMIHTVHKRRKGNVCTERHH